MHRQTKGETRCHKCGQNLKTNTMYITKKIAKKIVLRDDETEFGGTGFNGETLYDFIAEAGLKFCYGVNQYNKVLKECGIMPITKEEVKKAKELKYYVCYSLIPLKMFPNLKSKRWFVECETIEQAREIAADVCSLDGASHIKILTNKPKTCGIIETTKEDYLTDFHF